MAKVGRPKLETLPNGAGEEIIAWLSSGKFLTEYCCQKGNPSRTTVYSWMNKFPEFAEQVARAREMGEEVLFEQNMAIVDEMPPVDANGKTDSGFVAWQKNRIWARLEMLKRMNPKKYGDKVGVQHEGGVTLNVVTGVPEE